MASLATVSNFPDTVYGQNRVAYRDVTYSSSYATGGESITPTQVGMAAFAEVVPQVSKAGLLHSFDLANSKVQAYLPTGGAGAPAAGATPTAKVASGASTASAVDATQPNLLPGVAVEMPATRDLSSVTIRVKFIGR